MKTGIFKLTEKEIAAAAAWAAAVRRRIHQRPELGFREKETARLVATSLKDMGVNVKTGVAGTGVVGLIRGPKPGKTIALRADMDALPMQEATGLPYASRVKGVMHACGHDGHTAMLLGAARVISTHRGSLKGTVKLLFQPAEEGDGGGYRMEKAGVLANPDVDVIYALHGWPGLACGCVGLVEGACFAAADRVYITVFGRGGHGAMPHKAVDSIYLAAAIIQALQSIVSRRISALERAVVSICRVQGGSTHNIIPASVELEGTVRTFDRKVRRQILAEIRRICSRTAAIHGGRAECRFDEAYNAVVNDDKALKVAEKVAAGVLGRDKVKWINPTMGSEDFAYFLKRVPGAYLTLGTDSTGRRNFPVHSPFFDFNDQAIPAGIKVLSGLALEYLS